MQLAVLADIHGDLPALEAGLADVQQQRVDGIIVAGKSRAIHVSCELHLF